MMHRLVQWLLHYGYVVIIVLVIAENTDWASEWDYDSSAAPVARS